MFVGFVLGLLVGLQLGFWGWVIYTYLMSVKQYLADIRRFSARDPSVVKATTIQPVSGQGTSPNVVKPKTPKQLALDKLAQMRRGGQ